ncbi:CIC11C00000002826 [Sungouiella intermedia]|uniref:CIC11C00000002826 n=1 Tax=Sungouiella intermedia TaxID=45354 RepID=A0A1L0G5J5_9ASCO|nr:CIC11C00000002826 [[Candida] intermedia]
MKLQNLAVLSLACSAYAAISVSKKWFPLTRKGEIPTIEPYVEGQDVFIDCISRNIDTGEHKFDSNDRIVYTAFPTCKETGKPLTFHYGVLEDLNCTVVFTDELYHLFQLYIHEDAPFSCRIPLSTEANYMELGGATIPLTFNFRGEVRDSHLNVDPNLNVFFTKPGGKKPEQQSFISAVAWSSSTNATRVIIGDSLTLHMAVRWFDDLKNAGSLSPDGDGLPYADGFYKLPLNSIPISYNQYAFTLIMVAVISFVVSFAVSTRFRKRKSFHDRESDFGKKD